MNSKGEVDVQFHEEDEIEQSYTLVIRPQFMDIGEQYKYVFHEGLYVVHVPSENTVRWDAKLRFIDDYDHIFKTSFKLTRLVTNRVPNLILNVRECFQLLILNSLH